MKKVYITDYIKNPDIEKKILGKKVKVIALKQKNESLFPSIIKDADAILVWHTNLTEKTFKQLKKCKAIIRYGVGVDNIDLEAAKKNKILIANTPDYGIDEVADTASGLILTLCRKIFLYDNICKTYKKSWQENVPKENKIDPIKRLKKLNLGIIGIGRIGSALALRMKGFNFNIGFYDPNVRSGYEKTLGIKKFNSLKELAKSSNIISINCVLNKETKGMINSNFLKLVPNESIIVNTARGAIVDNLDVLYKGIISGKLSGVGLDVLPEEPPSKNEKLIKLWKNKKNLLSNKIIINPHAGYFSSDSIIEMRVKASENIKSALNNKKISNIII